MTKSVNKADGGGQAYLQGNGNIIYEQALTKICVQNVHFRNF